jgi:hypothetical protein
VEAGELKVDALIHMVWEEIGASVVITRANQQPIVYTYQTKA